MEPKRNQAKTAEAASLLNVLGNEKRLAIICGLLDREMSVGAIAQRVELSQSALSQHLAKLRKFELVETRRDRQTIFYACKSDKVRILVDALRVIYRPQ